MLYYGDTCRSQERKKEMFAFYINFGVKHKEEEYFGLVINYFNKTEHNNILWQKA